MKDRPGRRERGMGGVLAVGVLLMLGLGPGRTLAAGTPEAALLAAGISAGGPVAAQPVGPAKIQIPARPSLRSPYQPPVWVPGPPPWSNAPAWVPGPPPWTKPASGLVASKRVVAATVKK